MKILFFGNQDNLGYELCKWCLEFGVEGRVYSFDHDLPRSQPELVDPKTATDGYPKWFHIHKSLVSHIPFVSSKEAKALEKEFDVLVVSGTRGLLASNFINLPKLMYSIGGDVAEAPFPFAARWRSFPAFVFRILRFPFARMAINKMNLIIENYEFNLKSLAKLKLSHKRVCLGMPEDARDNINIIDYNFKKELEAKYQNYHRVFLWLTRINYLDPKDAAYKGCERFAEALDYVSEEIKTGKIRLVIGTHGHDVEAFIELLKTKGYYDYADFVPHMPFSKMLAYMDLEKAVTFGKFGELLGMPAAVDRDSFSIGAALISTVDKEYTNKIYGGIPPVLSAVTADEIGLRMKEITAMSAEDLRKLRAESRKYGLEHIDYRVIIPKFIELAKSLCCKE